MVRHRSPWIEHIFSLSGVKGWSCQSFSQRLWKLRFYEQPQETSFLPLNAEAIMAAAHPTPLSTVIAPVGQLSWQAPHSIQFSGCARLTTPLFRAKTAWRQTALHILQLLHNSWLNLSVFVKYALNIFSLQTRVLIVLWLKLIYLHPTSMPWWECIYTSPVLLQFVR